MSVTYKQASADQTLLSICAILRWFDRDVLRDLAECDDHQITTLLASDSVMPDAALAGAYRLRDAVQADALARLRDEPALDELEAHTRAFHYFVSRKAHAADEASRAADEDHCFHHLSELFGLLSARRAWPVMAEHVEAARVTGVRQARHRHRLALYDGYVAIRTHAYDRGESILLALLDQPDLEYEVRVLALNGLGQVHWFHTRYDRALELYQQVHALARSAGDQAHQGHALLNMSMVYNDIGYYERAIELVTQSLPLFRALGDRYREAHVLYEIGNNAMYLGRWQVAQRHFEEAIDLYEALGVQAGLAYLYWSRGFLHHMLGALPESEAAYLRALAISRSPEHGEPTVAMDCLVYLGFLYQTQERWDEALALYAEAITLATQLRNQHTLTLIHYRRGNVFQCRGQLDAAGAAYRQAIDGIEALRGATEREEIKIGLLGTTQQIYESMALLCLARGHLAEAFEYVERARSRAFLDTLAGKSPELYDAIDQPVVTLADVQARLPENALLVEYFTTGVLPRAEHLVNKLPPQNTRLRDHLVLPARVLIFAIARDSFEVQHASIDPNSLRPHPSDPGPGRRLLRGRLPAHLYEQLVAPVQHLLRGRSLLYLIPHGPLHYVPFMALRSASGEYLLDSGGPAIALAPSATNLLRNCLGRPPSQATEFLALGYDDQGEDALRYAEAEAAHVARLMGGRAWAGGEPKSERLIRAGRRVRWLHVAGHAVYNPQDPLGSELRLGVEDSLSARAIMSGLDLDVELVTLSACTSGLSHVVPGDELLGLQRAFLYAGAPAVVCTLWEAADFVALLVMERFYNDVRAGRSPAAALRDAQVAVRAMTGRELVATLDRWREEAPELIAALSELPVIAPEYLDTPIYDDPFYWAPFMLIGRP